MAVSNQTALMIAEVFLRHVPLETARRIVHDLEDVPGNKSFRDTVTNLASILERRWPKVDGKEATAMRRADWDSFHRGEDR